MIELEGIHDGGGQLCSTLQRAHQAGLPTPQVSNHDGCIQCYFLGNFHLDQSSAKLFEIRASSSSVKESFPAKSLGFSLLCFIAKSIVSSTETGLPKLALSITAISFNSRFIFLLTLNVSIITNTL